MRIDITCPKCNQEHTHAHAVVVDDRTRRLSMIAYAGGVEKVVRDLPENGDPISTSTRFACENGHQFSAVLRAHAGQSWIIIE